MARRYSKVGLGVVAAAVIAAVLFIPWGSTHSGQATAAEVIAQAVSAMSDLRAVNIRLNARTHARENFEFIDLDANFVSHEMWKEFGDTPRWRVEKPGRVVVMDGTSGTLLVGDPEVDPAGCTACKGAPDVGYVGWLLGLLDVDEVLDSELRLARSMGWEMELTHETNAAATDKLVVTIQATAQGDFTNDWCKNSSIWESDNTRIYRFDARTNLLEDLEVWVHEGETSVLVLDIEQIVYDQALDPDLFTLKVPTGVIWSIEPPVLPDNDKYARMTPREAAEAFFQALSDEDWDEVLKFWPKSEVNERMRQYCPGLEIIEIGEPFKSGSYPGWYVPYRIKLSSAPAGAPPVFEHNLAVRNDNAAGRYVVDGGI